MLEQPALIQVKPGLG